MYQKLQVKIIAVLMLSTTIVTSYEAGLAADWHAFKRRFNKTYGSPQEESFRLSIRAKNHEFMRRHNADAAAGKYDYTLRENHLVDQTHEEYKRRLGYRSPQEATRRTRRSLNIPSMPVYKQTVDQFLLPTTVNWTALGWVGPVEDQGQCGSCYTYSAAGALQSQFYNVTGQLVQLSKQILIDCTGPEGNLGCDGGSMPAAFWFVQLNGIGPFVLYPDVSSETGVNNACQYDTSHSVMNIASWRNVAAYNESALQQAVAHVGPVSAAVDASSSQFQLYSSGVFSDPLCSQQPQNLNHAVLIVGYGTFNGIPYWLIKNSWGTSWGINGYMMLARGSNMCGIATVATFPVAGWTNDLFSK